MFDECTAAELDIPASSLWLAPNPSKRWGELFFLCYTPFWLTLCLGIVVPYKLYEVNFNLLFSELKAKVIYFRGFMILGA